MKTRVLNILNAILTRMSKATKEGLVADLGLIGQNGGDRIHFLGGETQAAVTSLVEARIIRKQGSQGNYEACTPEIAQILVEMKLGERGVLVPA